jgi:chondroitin AC lyase
MNVDKGLEILANNRWIQAVRHNELGMARVIFYRAGELEISDHIKISLDSPGAVIVIMEREVIKEIAVADPSRKLNRLHMTISGKFYPDDRQGLQVEFDSVARMSHLAIDLPVDIYAGQSVVLDF